uniref:Uncharacterized protein n=1 Tax=Rhizophora mucronata TaxID=61149 RepID=A0A2P2QN62_RHIMU
MPPPFLLPTSRQTPFLHPPSLHFL